MSFADVYTKHLANQMQKHPDDYMGVPEDAPSIVAKMIPSLKAGRANINSNALRATCRELGITYNIASISQYLTGG